MLRKIFLGLTFSLLPVPGIAQTTPFPPPQDVLPPTQQPIPEQPFPATPPPVNLPTTPTTPPASVPGDPALVFEVIRYELIGNTVLNKREIHEATLAFTGKAITFAQALQAKDAINKLYADKGYITTGAYIPPQTLQNGIVQIQVLEGSLEVIQITGTKRLNPKYVRSRLALATLPPLNRKRLEEALQLLQLNPLIQSVKANLTKATQPGQNILQVAVNEAKSRQIGITLDNGRSPSVGSFRRQLRASEANLFGQGDGLSIGYTNTDGSNGFDVQYIYPLNARNGTLSFSYGNTFSSVIEPPFSALDINSQSSYYDLSFRQPLLLKPTQEFALSLGISRQASEASFFDGLIPYPSLGTDIEGKTRIWKLQFSQDWTQRTNHQVIALRSQLNFGLGAFDATLNDTGFDSRFWSWQGQGQWVRQIAPDTLFLWRTNLQFADRGLVSLQQFGIGGFDSVRGYRQDALLTDNAIFSSAEARVPIARFRAIKSLLQITPFVEVGTGWNNSGRSNPDPSTLASVGLGLRWQTGNRLSARFDWGIPLVSLESRNRTWQENGLYFSVLFNQPF